MPKVKHVGGIWPLFLATLAFVGGLALVVLTFKQAFDLYAVPLPEATGLKTPDGSPVDLQGTTDRVAGTVVRILILVMMAAAGSIIASRGIKLFETSFKYTYDPRDPAPAAESAVDKPKEDNGSTDTGSD